jgi:hypothetical protein
MLHIIRGAHTPFVIGLFLHPRLFLLHPGSAKVSLGELPTRLAGWLANTFSSSATDLPSVLTQSNLSPASLALPHAVKDDQVEFALDSS